MELQKEKMTLNELDAIEREEDRKKKKKEQVRMETESFLLYYSQMKKDESGQYRERIIDGLSAITPYLYKEAKELFEYGRECKERSKLLFGLNENTKEDKEIIEKLDEAKLSKRNFRTIALCKSNESNEKVLNFIAKSEIKEEDKLEIKIIRDNAFKKAVETVEEIKKKQYENTAKTLSSNLNLYIDKFANETDPKKAYFWSTEVKNILEVVKAKPEISLNKLFNKSLLDKSKEVAYFGIAIRDGLDAIEEQWKLANNFEKEKDVAQKMELLNMRVLNMKIIMDVKKCQIKEKELVFSKDTVNKGAKAIDTILEANR